MQEDEFIDTQFPVLLDHFMVIIMSIGTGIDPDFFSWPVCLCQYGLQARDLRSQLFRIGADGKPALALVGNAPETGFAVTGKNNGRMWTLNGLGIEAAGA